MRFTYRYLAYTVLLLSSILPAQADTFSFSFSNPGLDSSGIPIIFSGAGALTAELVSPGLYTIVGISGTTWNQTITELSSDYAADDDLLWPALSGGSLDSYGVTYSLQGGGLVSLFFSGGAYQEYDYVDGLYAVGPLNLTLTNLSPSVSEPHGIALLSLGACVLYGILRLHRMNPHDPHASS